MALQDLFGATESDAAADLAWLSVGRRQAAAAILADTRRQARDL